MRTSRKKNECRLQQCGRNRDDPTEWVWKGKAHAMWYCLYVEYEKGHKWTFYEAETDSQTEGRPGAAKEEGDGAGAGRECGMDRRKLLCAGWIHDKAHYTAIFKILWYTIMRKNRKKEWFCVYESVCCAAETDDTVSQLYFN